MKIFTINKQKSLEILILNKYSVSMLCAQHPMIAALMMHQL
jgi:hypothetical protein